jgi:hypothetical protein
LRKIVSSLDNNEMINDLVTIEPNHFYLGLDLHSSNCINTILHRSPALILFYIDNHIDITTKPIKIVRI